MRGARGPTRGDPSMDEVEEMLRAAEDDLLLNLTRDSHSTARRLESPNFPASLLSSSSSSLSPLDADLASRFDALKRPTVAKQPKSTAAAASAPAVAPKDRVTAPENGGGGGEDEWNAILGDDLVARFAALKGASSAVNPTIKAETAAGQKPASWERSKEGSSDSTETGSGVSESEVEKVMQWAMDSARLEPSSSLNTDGGISSDDEDKEEEDDRDIDLEDDKDEIESKPADPKAKAQGNRPKKWFLF